MSRHIGYPPWRRIATLAEKLIDRTRQWLGRKLDRARFPILFNLHVLPWFASTSAIFELPSSEADYSELGCSIDGFPLRILNCYAAH